LRAPGLRERARKPPRRYPRLTKNRRIAAATPRVDRARLTGDGSMKRSRSKFSGMKLKKLVSKNPRQPDTHGARHWKLYRDGMLFDELAVKKGFGYHHFRWDLSHDFIRMK
jgi:hypothetical protein